MYMSQIECSSKNHLWWVILKASLLARISNIRERIPYFREISLPAALFRFQGSREHEGEEYKQEKVHRIQEKNDRKKKERRVYIQIQRKKKAVTREEKETEQEEEEIR